VILHGRVLAVDGDRLILLADGATRVLSVPPEVSAPNAGDFVALKVIDDAVTHCERLGVSRAQPFPPATCDLLRLQRDGARLHRNLVKRAAILDGVRAFFRGRGFVEVETPLVVESAGVEVHLAPVEVRVSERPGAPATTRHLITSPEYQMKRLLAGGMERIFQVSKVFRDGEHGRRHRVEFTMLEWYRAFADYEALMTDCEELVTSLAAVLGLGTTLDLGGRRLDLARPWRRLTFRDALRERGGVPDPDALTPDEQERVLVERVDPSLGRDAPEFLIEWPASMASLARRKFGDPLVAERVELYAGGLELANGFSELVDPDEQAARFSADLAERDRLGLPRLPIDEGYLDALRVGVPPAAGIALGVDRLVMLLLGESDIANVLAF
jgi:lysyl-tRNA synthetase class 2